MSDICVAHLVRKQNGLAPFERFIESYRTHSAGVDHDLLVIYKSLGDSSEVQQYENLLRDIPHRSFFVNDVGIDLGSYLSAAREFDYNYFCFLNSFSVIQDQGWLGKMYKHVRHEGVGIVGATGSHESMFNNLIHAIHRDSSRPRQKLMPRLARGFRFVVNSVQFPRFPNYHVRSNSFMLSRELMLRLKLEANKLRSKRAGYHLESGKESLTRQIFAMGLQALVVGRDGMAYEKERWCESRTYRSGEQKNLLVADNQTRFYEAADSQTKATLTKNTWGGC
jgi:hypothetical protein